MWGSRKEGRETVAKRDLTNVAKAKAKVDAAREELEQAMVAAFVSGETVREIARYAGVTHQRVHQIVQGSRPPREPQE